MLFKIKKNKSDEKKKKKKKDSGKSCFGERSPEFF